jgi:lipoate-protein ligase A
MAYDMNHSRMLEILRIGKEKLSDKGVASADKRVGPLRQQTNLSRAAVIDHLIGHFRERFGLVDDEVAPDELAEAEDRAISYFGTRNWTHYLP